MCIDCEVLISMVDQYLINESDSSSSSDEEPCLNKKRRVLRPRVSGYWDTISRYNVDEFKSHFRLTRSTLERVLEIVGADLVRSQSSGNPQLPAGKQVLIAIWRMANTESYRSVCDRFDIGKATGHACVRRVTHALVKRRAFFIKWPTANETTEISRGFQAGGMFPSIIGAIDGTHIEIESPIYNKEDYINRKGFPSIQLQAVCDHRYLLTHIFVGYPGSVHDQRVFRISPLQNYLNDPNKFPNDTHLIGDPAYTIHPNLMVPFKDNGQLTRRQKNFNFCASSSRCTIERCFGLLKGRWRSLLHCLPMSNLAEIPNYIAACCVLHNICILESDIFENIASGNDVNEQNIVELPGEILHAEGCAKRNRIMRALPMRDI